FARPLFYVADSGGRIECRRLAEAGGGVLNDATPHFQDRSEARYAVIPIGFARPLFYVADSGGRIECRRLAEAGGGVLNDATPHFQDRSEARYAVIFLHGREI